MSRRIDSNGVEIAFEVSGEGAPLLLITGIGYSRWCWKWLIKHLADRFRTITVDNRCSGESGCPEEPFTMADMANDCGAVLDSLGIDRAMVFGVSMGGFIAQHLALDHPERVSKLILGCTHLGASKMAPLSAETVALLSDRSGTPEEQIRRGMPYSFRPGWVTEHPEEFERIVALRLDHQPAPEIFLRQLSATQTFDVGEKAAQIAAPTMIIQGTADRVVPAENARLIHETIPGSQLVLLDGAGHLFFIEEADRVARLIDDFAG